MNITKHKVKIQKNQEPFFSFNKNNNNNTDEYDFKYFIGKILPRN